MMNINCKGDSEFNKGRTSVRSHLPCTLSCRGFTLIEVMIALAIISIALTVIIHTVNFQTGIAYNNTQKTILYQLAREKMYELQEAPHNSEGLITRTIHYENRAEPIQETNLVMLTTVLVSSNQKAMLQTMIVVKKEDN